MNIVKHPGLDSVLGESIMLDCAQELRVQLVGVANENAMFMTFLHICKYMYSKFFDDFKEFIVPYSWLCL